MTAVSKQANSRSLALCRSRNDLVYLFHEVLEADKKQNLSTTFLSKSLQLWIFLCIFAQI